MTEVADVLNTRHEVAKENGWKEKPPAKSAFIKAVLEDNNLIRRPIFVDGDRVVIGWDEKAIRKLLG